MSIDKEHDTLLLNRQVALQKQILDSRPDFLPTSSVAVEDLGTFILKWTIKILKANGITIPNPASIFTVPAPIPHFGIGVIFGAEWGHGAELMYNLSTEDIRVWGEGGTYRVKSLELFRRVKASTLDVYTKLQKGGSKC